MKVEFQGETPGDIVMQMYAFLDLINPGTEHPANEPEAEEPVPAEENAEKPKKPKTRKRKKPAEEPEEEMEAPTPEPEPAPEPEIEPAEAKKQAIDILIELYNENRQADVKKLLAEFGVKKFGEVPDEKGKDLLDKANGLRKEAA